MTVRNPPWMTRPLDGVSNQEIVLQKGTELAARKGAFKRKGDCLHVSRMREHHIRARRRNAARRRALCARRTISPRHTNNRVAARTELLHMPKRADTGPRDRADRGDAIYLYPTRTSPTATSSSGAWTATATTGRASASSAPRTSDRGLPPLCNTRGTAPEAALTSSRTRPASRLSAAWCATAWRRTTQELAIRSARRP